MLVDATGVGDISSTYPETSPSSCLSPAARRSRARLIISAYRRICSVRSRKYPSVYGLSFGRVWSLSAMWGTVAWIHRIDILQNSRYKAAVLALSFEVRRDQ